MLQFTTLWMSNKSMTVRVTIDQNDYIIDAAPVVRKFIGQRYRNLRSWLDKNGDYHEEILDGYEIHG